MRILLLTTVYPTSCAPMKGSFNAALVAGLRRAGDEVRVVVPVPWTEHRMRLTGREVPDGEAHPIWFFPPKIGRANYHRWMRRSVLPAAHALSDAWAPELVLGYWTHPDGTVALEYAKRIGTPAVMLVGGSDIQLLTADRRRRKVIIETLLAANRVLTVGATLREQVVALGVPADRVGVFSRGVNRERFALGDRAAARSKLGLPLDRPIALWVGHMVQVKGLDLLLRAWQRVIQRGGALPILLLAGRGQEQRTLESTAATLGDSVRFLGGIPNAALPDWYRAADILVLPSRSEGVPNVLLEGLACGTSFIASDVGAIRELLEPSSRVVPAGDISALSAALCEALAAPPLTRYADSSHIPDSDDAIAALRAVLSGIVESTASGDP